MKIRMAALAIMVAIAFAACTTWPWHHERRGDRQTEQQRDHDNRNHDRN